MKGFHSAADSIMPERLPCLPAAATVTAWLRHDLRISRFPIQRI